jgi:hypothetical protein
VIFDQAVLHRPIGGEDVMRGQLDALATAAATRPTVSIQVLPYTAKEHAGLDGRFTILSYPDPADPDIAYVEGTMGDVYLESAEAIAKHRDRFQRIEDAALSPEDSAHLIAEAARSSP